MLWLNTFHLHEIPLVEDLVKNRYSFRLPDSQVQLAENAIIGIQPVKERSNEVRQHQYIKMFLRRGSRPLTFKEHNDLINKEYLNSGSATDWRCNTTKAWATKENDYFQVLQSTHDSLSNGDSLRAIDILYCSQISAPQFQSLIEAEGRRTQASIDLACPCKKCRRNFQFFSTIDNVEVLLSLDDLFLNFCHKATLNTQTGLFEVCAIANIVGIYSQNMEKALPLLGKEYMVKFGWVEEDYDKLVEATIDFEVEEKKQELKMESLLSNLKKLRATDPLQQQSLRRSHSFSDLRSLDNLTNTYTDQNFFHSYKSLSYPDEDKPTSQDEIKKYKQNETRFLMEIGVRKAATSLKTCFKKYNLDKSMFEEKLVVISELNLLKTNPFGQRVLWTASLVNRTKDLAHFWKLGTWMDLFMSLGTKLSNNSGLKNTFKISLNLGAGLPLIKPRRRLFKPDNKQISFKIPKPQSFISKKEFEEFMDDLNNVFASKEFWNERLKTAGICNLLRIITLLRGFLLLNSADFFKMISNQNRRNINIYLMVQGLVFLLDIMGVKIRGPKFADIEYTMKLSDEYYSAFFHYIMDAFCNFIFYFFPKYTSPTQGANVYINLRYWATVGLMNCLLRPNNNIIDLKTAFGGQKIINMLFQNIHIRNFLRFEAEDVFYANLTTTSLQNFDYDPERSHLQFMRDFKLDFFMAPDKLICSLDYKSSWFQTNRHILLCTCRFGLCDCKRKVFYTCTCKSFSRATCKCYPHSIISPDFNLCKCGARNFEECKCGATIHVFGLAFQEKPKVPLKKGTWTHNPNISSVLKDVQKTLDANRFYNTLWSSEKNLIDYFNEIFSCVYNPNSKWVDFIQHKLPHIFSKRKNQNLKRHILHPHFFLQYKPTSLAVFRELLDLKEAMETKVIKGQPPVYFSFWGHQFLEDAIPGITRLEFMLPAIMTATQFCAIALFSLCIGNQKRIRASMRLCIKKLKNKVNDFMKGHERILEMYNEAQISSYVSISKTFCAETQEQYDQLIPLGLALGDESNMEDWDCNDKDNKTKTENSKSGSKNQKNKNRKKRVNKYVAYDSEEEKETKEKTKSKVEIKRVDITTGLSAKESKTKESANKSLADNGLLKKEKTIPQENDMVKNNNEGKKNNHKTVIQDDKTDKESKAVKFTAKTEKKSESTHVDTLMEMKQGEQLNISKSPASHVKKEKTVMGHNSSSKETVCIKKDLIQNDKSRCADTKSELKENSNALKQNKIKREGKIYYSDEKPKPYKEMRTVQLEAQSKGKANLLIREALISKKKDSELGKKMLQYPMSGKTEKLKRDFSQEVVSLELDSNEESTSTNGDFLARDKESLLEKFLNLQTVSTEKNLDSKPGKIFSTFDDNLTIKKSVFLSEKSSLEKSTTDERETKEKISNNIKSKKRPKRKSWVSIPWGGESNFKKPEEKSASFFESSEEEYDTTRFDDFKQGVLLPSFLRVSEPNSIPADESETCFVDSWTKKNSQAEEQNNEWSINNPLASKLFGTKPTEENSKCLKEDGELKKVDKETCFKEVSEVQQFLSDEKYKKMANSYGEGLQEIERKINRLKKADVFSKTAIETLGFMRMAKKQKKILQQVFDILGVPGTFEDNVLDMTKAFSVVNKAKQLKRFFGIDDSSVSDKELGLEFFRSPSWMDSFNKNVIVFQSEMDCLHVSEDEPKQADNNELKPAEAKQETQDTQRPGSQSSENSLIDLAMAPEPFGYHSLCGALLPRTRDYFGAEQLHSETVSRLAGAGNVAPAAGPLAKNSYRWGCFSAIKGNSATAKQQHASCSSFSSNFNHTKPPHPSLEPVLKWFESNSNETPTAVSHTFNIRLPPVQVAAVTFNNDYLLDEAGGQLSPVLKPGTSQFEQPASNTLRSSSEQPTNLSTTLHSTSAPSRSQPDISHSSTFTSAHMPLVSSNQPLHFSPAPSQHQSTTMLQSTSHFQDPYFYFRNSYYQRLHTLNPSNASPMPPLLFNDSDMIPNNAPLLAPTHQIRETSSQPVHQQDHQAQGSSQQGQLLLQQPFDPPYLAPDRLPPMQMPLGDALYSTFTPYPNERNNVCSRPVSQSNQNQSSVPSTSVPTATGGNNMTQYGTAIVPAAPISPMQNYMMSNILTPESINPQLLMNQQAHMGHQDLIWSQSQAFNGSFGYDGNHMPVPYISQPPASAQMLTPERSGSNTPQGMVSTSTIPSMNLNDRDAFDMNNTAVQDSRRNGEDGPSAFFQGPGPYSSEYKDTFSYQKKRKQ